MLTGKELGHAISKAIELKGISKAELAREFKIAPPSIQDWIKFGRVAKKHINHLVDFFSDVVPPEYWGFPSVKIEPKQQARFEHSFASNENMRLLNAVAERLLSGEKSPQIDLALLAMRQLVESNPMPKQAKNTEESISYPPSPEKTIYPGVTWASPHSRKKKAPHLLID